MHVNCHPYGICSWNYRLAGQSPDHRAELHFNWGSESGRITVGGVDVEVKKQGFMSGEWKLLTGEQCLCTAQKSSAFRRKFEMSWSGGQAVLEAESAFGRAMTVVGHQINCRISPAHAFTRRAVIEGEAQDFLLVAFSFWLTAQLWRRAANNSGGAGAT